MKKVFLSHPFGADPDLNNQRINYIVKRIISKNNDILPLSPLHLFGFYGEDNPTIREPIMDTCFHLIDLADELWVYIYDMKQSPGQLREVRFALDAGKEVKYFNGDLATEGMNYEHKRPA